jgi:hypothetical protein
MKSRLMLLAAGLVALAAFAGCKSLPTAQAQFNALCPIVTADLQTLSTSALLTSDQQTKALKAHDFNVKICAAGASLNVADVKDFANTALPAISSIVAAIPDSPSFPSTTIALALNTFGPLALQLVEQTVSTVQGASAPAAASTPLAGAPLQ